MNVFNILPAQAFLAVELTLRQKRKRLNSVEYGWASGVLRNRMEKVVKTRAGEFLQTRDFSPHCLTFKLSFLNGRQGEFDGEGSSDFRLARNLDGS